MRQTNIIFGTILLAFVIYITMRGQLPAYLDLFKKGSSSSSGSSSSGSGILGSLSSLGKSIGSIGNTLSSLSSGSDGLGDGSSVSI